MVRSGDGASGVVKGIIGGREVGISTEVEKKKLGWIEIEDVAGTSMLDLTVKGTERTGVDVKKTVSITVAVSSISSVTEVETAAAIVVSGAGLRVSRGREASEEGTTLVGGTVATEEVSTAVKTGVDWSVIEELSTVDKMGVDRSITEVVRLGIRDGTGVVETSTSTVVNSTSISI